MESDINGDMRHQVEQAWADIPPRRRFELAKAEMETFIQRGEPTSAERWRPEEPQTIPEMTLIRSLLTPALEMTKRNEDSALFYEVAELLADAFFCEHRYNLAIIFFDLARHKLTMSGLRKFADALYGAERLEEALHMYRAAYFKAEQATVK